MQRYIQQSSGFYLAARDELADESAPMRIDAPGKDGSIRVPMEDYRKEWSYLGTFSVLGENGAAELHVVYTQPTTVEAYRKTGRFPDGAVLVKELYEAQSEDLTTGRVSWSGKATGWFVLIKDTEGRFPNNPLWGDGWGLVRARQTGQSRDQGLQGRLPSLP